MATQTLSEELYPRWATLWQEFSPLEDPGAEIFATMVKCYAEPHRAYHTLQHVADCLVEFDHVRHLAELPHLVELAIWTHDVLYDPHAKDNERASSRWIEMHIKTRISGYETLMLRNMIIATEHVDPPQTPDVGLMQDIDLTILGSEPERFDTYERQIKYEYAFIPDDTFRAARAKILQRFLDRPTIYHTPIFFEDYEEMARENLKYSIAKLTPKLTS
jgi:predicted metal-dependent HD superfamily phosphohydrolase